jgi:hypothetical protein
MFRVIYGHIKRRHNNPEGIQIESTQETTVMRKSSTFCSDAYLYRKAELVEVGSCVKDTSCCVRAEM